ncbi:DUF3017 domain-containing protein [Corynebacterium anserum]|uniref:DUF3017 domain-containing protein n=1 Tax=Corynebacterium anserum TaxID=2684406 RepID=A0A7G7YPU5_9CORY|nr:DUF3017 domain-containing protein [Corynebacterium anserum]MBC2682161.1 DUF3017 domain-containing protein [Corynebacterium anserum]QNH96515.1 DUF3017 domain-containing protein [Corynebacterium anserum]
MSPRIGQVRERLLDNPHDRAVPPSPLHRNVQRALVGLFVALVAVAAFFLGVERWRRGTVVLGFALLYLSSVRWLVDSRILGVLSVRSRKFDSVFTAALGLAMLWLSLSVDPLGS